MPYIPHIDGYAWKIEVKDDFEVKDFVAINFGKYFKSMKE